MNVKDNLNKPWPTELFLTTYLQIGRIQLNQILEINQSFLNFLTKFNTNLDTHASLKKLPKQKLKFRNKLRVTLGLQKISFN